MANNLMHWDPFREMMRGSGLQRFEDFFRDFRPPGLREGQEVPQIRLDVAETDKDYTVKAEIPGLKKEDIKVDIIGNRVTISAETQRKEEQKEGSKLVRSELYYGQQYRSFTLDEDIDDSKAEAKYVDGVLELVLPKKAGRAGHKLEIH